MTPVSIRTLERPPYVAQEQPPLLILLHGYGSNEQDLMGLAPHLDERLYIVSAQAPIDLGGAYAWYHLSGVPGQLIADRASRAASLSMLQKFVPQVIERTRANPRQVYLLGFSQGCVMGMSVAMLMPETIAGVVALSGYLDDAVLPGVAVERLDGLAVLWQHGTDDAVIPVEQGRKAKAWLAQTPADLTYVEYPIGHSIHPQGFAVIQNWLIERLDQA